MSKVNLTIDAIRPDDQRLLAEFTDAYHMYSKQEKALAELKKSISDALLDLLNSYGADQINDGSAGVKVTKAQTNTKKIDAGRLLERGVGPDIIAYATVETVGKEYVRVSFPKEGE